MSEAVVPLYGIINRETEELTGVTYPGGGADRYTAVSREQTVTVAMVQANTAPAGGEGYCGISDGDGSIYPRAWRLYWLASGPYYTLADIKSIDGKVN